MLNIVLVLALCLGVLPPAMVQASSADRPLQNELCVRSTNSGEGQRVFLPIIQNLTRLFRSRVQPELEIHAPVQTARQLQYEVGKTYTYEYEVNVDIASVTQTREEVNEDRTRSNTIYSLVDITITDQDADGGFKGQLIMRVPFICNTNGETEGVMDDQETLDSLAQPLLFEQAPNGTITKISTPAEASAEAVNLQKGALNAMQVNLQESTSYTAEELGGQGTYEASYAVVETEDGLQINKSYDQDSFTNLIQRGDTVDSLLINANFTMILDSERNVLTNIEYTELVSSVDEAQLAYSDFDGVLNSTKAYTQGKLNLLSVTPASDVSAASATKTYVDGDMRTEILDDYGNESGIDIDTINLENEFAQIENSVNEWDSTSESPPVEPEIIANMIELIGADPNNIVLDTIQERIQRNADNITLVNVYLDILTAAETPYAQQIITSILEGSTVHGASVAVTYNTESQERALMALALQDSPTITTATTIQALSNSENYELQGTAITALGAIASSLSDENAELANDLTAELENDLLALTDTENSGEIETYLAALGNTANSTALDTIKDFVQITETTELTETLGIQAAALYATSQIPGSEAEELLLGALNDDSRPQPLILDVADMLANRDLSEEGVAALNDFNAPQALANAHRTWEKSSGPLKFPGYYRVVTPPDAPKLYIDAAQEIVFEQWPFPKIDIIKAQTRIYQKWGWPSRYRFGIYLYVRDKLIKSDGASIVYGCNLSRSGNLWQGTFKIDDARVKVNIISSMGVVVTVSLHANFSLPWSVNYNFCDTTAITSEINFRPYGKVSGSAEKNANIGFVRGGAGVRATVLDSSFPIKLTAASSGSSVRFCSNVQFETKPLSYATYTWYQWRTIKNWRITWGRRHEDSDEKTFLNALNFRIIDACW